MNQLSYIFGLNITLKGEHIFIGIFYRRFTAEIVLNVFFCFDATTAVKQYTKLFNVPMFFH